MNYIVRVRQWVEELSDVEVIADTPEEARKFVQSNADDLDIEWTDGFEVRDFEVIAVQISALAQP